MHGCGAGSCCFTLMSQLERRGRGRSRPQNAPLGEGRDGARGSKQKRKWLRATHRGDGGGRKRASQIPPLGHVGKEGSVPSVRPYPCQDTGGGASLPNSLFFLSPLTKICQGNGAGIEATPIFQLFPSGVCWGRACPLPAREPGSQSGERRARGCLPAAPRAWRCAWLQGEGRACTLPQNPASLQGSTLSARAGSFAFPLNAYPPLNQT